MKVIQKSTAAQVDLEAAKMVAAAVDASKKPVLGLPTGGTPEGMYKNLVAMCKEGKLSFVNVTTFNLDEYTGLDGTSPMSYRYFMQNNLFDHVDIIPENTHVPSGIGDMAALEEEGRRYDDAIAAAGGIDLMVLGIGANGHIGFNEPGTDPELGTHVTSLDQKTINDNARYFDSVDDVPRTAITMGIKTILGCKRILLIAKGKGKAEIINAMINGPITKDVPASFLQNHLDVTVIVDKEAGELL